MSFETQSHKARQAVRRLDAMANNRYVTTGELARAVNVQPAWIRQLVGIDAFAERTILIGTRQRVFANRRTIRKLKRQLESI